MVVRKIAGLVALVLFCCSPAISQIPTDTRQPASIRSVGQPKSFRPAAGPATAEAQPSPRAAGVDGMIRSSLIGDGPILARSLFYKNSQFAQASDEAAIATDKLALFEGETASFENYSSYLHGINGILLDMTGVGSNLTLSDFEFLVGNDNSPDHWSTAPNPTLTIFPNAGIDGSDRIKLTWPDGAITKTWLQVRLLANSHTGLAQDDIFYFGNAIGETGNSIADAKVNLSDSSGARNNLSGFSSVPIDNVFDFNRDGRVRLGDYSIARSNQSGFLPLKLVTPLTNQAFSAGLGRGTNFGNMLEAPSEGAWGFFVQSIFFDKVVEAGLEHIRLPISWTHHASLNSPYTIDEVFFLRIDWCVEQAKLRGLKIIVNMHHYDELNANPTAEWTRALAIWSQIATRYQNEPETVFFEVLNEPHGAFNTNPATWNLFMVDAINVIRATNPTRKILVGPVRWNSIGSLNTFFPPNDPNLIATVHYYDPFGFTHQGASWVNPSPPVGTPWFGPRVGFGSNWQNWSWSTTFTSTNNGLQTQYDAGWAAARFHTNSLIAGTEKLAFTTQGATNLKIWIIDENGNNSDSVFRQTSGGTHTHTIDFSEFGNPGTVRDVVFQNPTANPAAAFTFNSVRLLGPNTISHLLNTESSAVKNSFLTAAKWSVSNDIPLHLGEFGSFGLADMASRARWTTEVRQAAESFNIDWAYWEMVAGFGFYNSANDTWRTPLIEALNPSFGN